jgi:hypothetical protein
MKREPCVKPVGLCAGKDRKAQPFDGDVVNGMK